VVCAAYQVGEYVVEVYDNPATNLSPSAQDKLIQDCLSVAQDGFGTQHVDAEVVRRHVLHVSTSVIIRQGYDQVIGIAGSSVLQIENHRIIYLQGATILNACRSRGLYKLSVAVRILAEAQKLEANGVGNSNVLIGTRTQNPIIYEILHRNLKLFPYTCGYVDNDIKDIAQKFSRKIYAQFNDFDSSVEHEFDSDYFVARKSFMCMLEDKKFGLNIYGSNTPFCKDDDEINKYMRENINYENGDALIILGYYCQQKVSALLKNNTLEINAAVLTGV
jgi:hypothetical protein